jgi:hypothetical protein
MSKIIYSYLKTEISELEEQTDIKTNTESVTNKHNKRKFDNTSFKEIQNLKVLKFSLLLPLFTTYKKKKNSKDLTTRLQNK